MDPMAFRVQSQKSRLDAAQKVFPGIQRTCADRLLLLSFFIPLSQHCEGLVIHYLDIAARYLAVPKFYWG